MFILSRTRVLLTNAFSGQSFFWMQLSSQLAFSKFVVTIMEGLPRSCHLTLSKHLILEHTFSPTFFA